jgi:hypothetical protein
MQRSEKLHKKKKLFFILFEPRTCIVAELFCKVVSNNPYNLSTQSSYGDRLALALEVGNSLEIGQRGHSLNFGIKYESDIAGSQNTMGSIGFRVSYAFNFSGGRITKCRCSCGLHQQCYPSKQNASPYFQGCLYTLKCPFFFGFPDSQTIFTSLKTAMKARAIKRCIIMSN